ncbi:MAG: endonuclease NucS domain-containing protein [Promethearchaeota archaeon]
MFRFDEESLSEKKIQNLYQIHPYLIEKEFLNQKTIPQYCLPSGFADIVIFIEKEIVVIELKVETLDSTHLLQLNGYLEDMQSLFKDAKKIRGILIGRNPIKDLWSLKENFSFEIKILVLDSNIPTKVKICNYCRLANDIKNNSCVYCNGDSFL